MKASLLICIALVCIAAASANTNEKAVENKIFGQYWRLPGIYRPPVVAPVVPSCKNDKTGCPTTETCVAPAACSTTATRTPCAATADCPASCASGSCVACQVQC